MPPVSVILPAAVQIEKYTTKWYYTPTVSSNEMFVKNDVGGKNFAQEGRLYFLAFDLAAEGR